MSGLLKDFGEFRAGAGGLGKSVKGVAYLGGSAVKASPTTPRCALTIQQLLPGSSSLHIQPPSCSICPPFVGVYITQHYDSHDSPGLPAAPGLQKLLQCKHQPGGNAELNTICPQ